MKVDFAEWLNGELRKRSMSQAELSRASDLSTAQISRLLTRKSMPGIDAYEGIARAFNVPVETVIAAGSKKPETEKKSLLEHMFDMLPEDEQDDILDFVRFKQEQWRREQAGQAGKPKPVTGELK